MGSVGLCQLMLSLNMIVLLTTYCETLESVLSSLDHLWYFLAAAASIGTFWVALKALKSWQHQKLYDLTIENLALCNVAVDLISFLRSPVSNDDEIKAEYLKAIDANEESLDELSRRALKAWYLFESRRELKNESYDAILKLRETNWAVFGPGDNYYKFYDRIVALVIEIRAAYINNYYRTKGRDEFSAEENKHIRIANRKVMYELNDDEITTELKNWIITLEKRRGSKPRGFK